MAFNSNVFVFLFFPVCLAGYYLLSGKRDGLPARLWLTGMSLWFYGWFNVWYLPLLIGSIAFNYAMFRLIRQRGGADAGRAGQSGQSSPSGKRFPAAKALLAAGIAGNLLLLSYFKYAGFFAGGMKAEAVILPLGISFFTFQQIAFLTDAYRGEVRSCGFGDYLLFVSFFPYVVSGPITLHEEMLPQLRRAGTGRFQAEKFMQGLSLFVLGLGKKTLLADTFGKAVDFGYAGVSSLSQAEALLVMFAYSFQLYFDFSGYCDMGRGIGRMLGLELPVNFNSPYKAENIGEFWKRWHITLTRFLTRYVYIPLGGNRRGKARMYRNFLIVFLLSGLWHGAGVTFLIWGGLHGLLYIATRAWQGRKARAKAAEAGSVPPAPWRKALCTAGTFLYVSAAWVFFRAESVGQAAGMFKAMLTGGSFRIGKAFADCFKLDEFWYVLKVLHADAWKYGHNILMVLMFLFSAVLVFWGKNAAQAAVRIKPKVWTAVLMAGLMLWCVLSFSQVASFVYFNF